MSLLSAIAKLDINIPTESDYKETDGYLFEYENGYTSWSPKDVFEESYQEIHNGEFAINYNREYKSYQNNVILEFEEISNKTEKLALYILSDAFLDLSYKKQSILKKQLKCMSIYRSILYSRIVDF